MNKKFWSKPDKYPELKINLDHVIIVIIKYSEFQIVYSCEVFSFSEPVY